MGIVIDKFGPGASRSEIREGSGASVKSLLESTLAVSWSELSDLTQKNLTLVGAQNASKLFSEISRLDPDAQRMVMVYLLPQAISEVERTGPSALRDLRSAVNSRGADVWKIFGDSSGLVFNAFRFHKMPVGSSASLLREPTIRSFVHSTENLPFEIFVYQSQKQWWVVRGNEKSVLFSKEEAKVIREEADLHIHNHPGGMVFPSAEDLLSIREGGVGIIAGVFPGGEVDVALYGTPVINPDTGMKFKDPAEKEAVVVREYEKLDQALATSADPEAFRKALEEKLLLRMPLTIFRLGEKDSELTLTEFAEKYNPVAERPAVAEVSAAPRSEVRGRSEFWGLDIAAMGFVPTKTPRITAKDNALLANRIEVFRHPEQFEMVENDAQHVRLAGDILTLVPDPAGPLGAYHGLAEIYAGRDQDGQLRYVGLSLFKSQTSGKDATFIPLEEGSGRFLFTAADGMLFYADFDDLMIIDLIRRDYEKIPHWLSGASFQDGDLSGALGRDAQGLMGIYRTVTQFQKGLRGGVLESIDTTQQSGSIIFKLHDRHEKIHRFVIQSPTLDRSKFQAWIDSRSEVRGRGAGVRPIDKNASGKDLAKQLHWSARSWHEIGPFLLDAAQQGLLTHLYVDIDDTLVEPLGFHNAVKQYTRLAASQAPGMDAKAWVEIATSFAADEEIRMAAHRFYRTVGGLDVELLKTLRHRYGVQIVALTARPDSAVDRTRAMLATVDLREGEALDSLHFVFHKIIYTGDPQLKAEMLEADFNDSNGSDPGKAVFIDDQVANTEGVNWFFGGTSIRLDTEDPYNERITRDEYLRLAAKADEANNEGHAFEYLINAFDQSPDAEKEQETLVIAQKTLSSGTWEQFERTVGKQREFFRKYEIPRDILRVSPGKDTGTQEMTATIARSEVREQKAAPEVRPKTTSALFRWLWDKTDTKLGRWVIRPALVILPGLVTALPHQVGHFVGLVLTGKFGRAGNFIREMVRDPSKWLRGSEQNLGLASTLFGLLATAGIAIVATWLAAHFGLLGFSHAIMFYTLAGIGAANSLFFMAEFIASLANPASDLRALWGSTKSSSFVVRSLVRGAVILLFAAAIGFPALFWYGRQLINSNNPSAQSVTQAMGNMQFGLDPRSERLLLDSKMFVGFKPSEVAGYNDYLRDWLFRFPVGKRHIMIKALDRLQQVQRSKEKTDPWADMSMPGELAGNRNNGHNLFSFIEFLELGYLYDYLQSGYLPPTRLPGKILFSPDDAKKLWEAFSGKEYDAAEILVDGFLGTGPFSGECSYPLGSDRRWNVIYFLRQLTTANIPFEAKLEYIRATREAGHYNNLPSKAYEEMYAEINKVEGSFWTDDAHKRRAMIFISECSRFENFSPMQDKIVSHYGGWKNILSKMTPALQNEISVIQGNWRALVERFQVVEGQYVIPRFLQEWSFEQINTFDLNFRILVEKGEYEVRNTWGRFFTYCDQAGFPLTPDLPLKLIDPQQKMNMLGDYLEAWKYFKNGTVEIADKEAYQALEAAWQLFMSAGAEQIIYGKIRTISVANPEDWEIFSYVVRQSAGVSPLLNSRVVNALKPVYDQIKPAPIGNFTEFLNALHILNFLKRFYALDAVLYPKYVAYGKAMEDSGVSFEDYLAQLPESGYEGFLTLVNLSRDLDPVRAERLIAVFIQSKYPEFTQMGKMRNLSRVEEVRAKLNGISPVFGDEFIVTIAANFIDTHPVTPANIKELLSVAKVWKYQAPDISRDVQELYKQVGYFIANEIYAFVMTHPVPDKADILEELKGLGIMILDAGSAAGWQAHLNKAAIYSVQANWGYMLFKATAAFRGGKAAVKEGVSLASNVKVGENKELLLPEAYRAQDVTLDGKNVAYLFTGDPQKGARVSMGFDVGFLNGGVSAKKFEAFNPGDTLALDLTVGFTTIEGTLTDIGLEKGEVKNWLMSMDRAHGLVVVYKNGAMRIIDKRQLRIKDLYLDFQESQYPDRPLNLGKIGDYFLFRNIAKAQKLSGVANMLLINGEETLPIEDKPDSRRLLLEFSDGQIGVLNMNVPASTAEATRIARAVRLANGARVVKAVYCDTGSYDYVTLHTSNKGDVVFGHSYNPNSSHRVFFIYKKPAPASGPAGRSEMRAGAEGKMNRRAFLRWGGAASLGLMSLPGTTFAAWVSSPVWQELLEKWSKMPMFPSALEADSFAGSGAMAWLNLTARIWVCFMVRVMWPKGEFAVQRSGQGPDTVYIYDLPRDLNVGEALQWLAAIKKLPISYGQEIMPKLAASFTRLAAWMAQRALAHAPGSGAVPDTTQAMISGVWALGQALAKEALEVAVPPLEEMAAGYPSLVTKESEIFDWLGLTAEQAKQFRAAFEGGPADILDVVLRRALTLATDSVRIEIKALMYFCGWRSYKNRLGQDDGRMHGVMAEIKAGLMAAKNGSPESVRRAQKAAVEKLASKISEFPGWVHSDAETYMETSPAQVRLKDEINCVGRTSLMAMYLEELVGEGLLEGVKIASAVSLTHIRLVMQFGEEIYWVDAAALGKASPVRFYPMTGDLEGFRLKSLKIGIMVSFLLDLGGCLPYQKTLEADLAVYREALVIDPASIGAHVGLGETFLFWDKIDKAFDEFCWVLDFDFANSAALTGLGDTLLHRYEGKNKDKDADRETSDRAIAMFRKVLDTDSANVPALVGLGWGILLRNEDQDKMKIDEAIVAFRKARDIEPKNIRALVGWGQSVLLRYKDESNNRIDEVIDAYREGLKASPGNRLLLDHLKMAEEAKQQARSEMREAGAEGVLGQLGNAPVFSSRSRKAFAGAGNQMSWLNLTDHIRVDFFKRSPGQKASFDVITRGEGVDSVYSFQLPDDLTVSEVFQLMAAIRNLPFGNGQEILPELAESFTKIAVWMAQEALRKTQASERKGVPAATQTMISGLYGIALALTRGTLDGVIVPSLEEIAGRLSPEDMREEIFGWLGLTGGQIRQFEDAFEGGSPDITDIVLKKAIKIAADTARTELKALTYFRGWRLYKAHLGRHGGRMAVAMAKIKARIKVGGDSPENVRLSQKLAVVELARHISKFTGWVHLDTWQMHRESSPEVARSTDEINCLGRTALMAMYLEDLAGEGLLEGVKVSSAVSAEHVKLVVEFGKEKYWVDAAEPDGSSNQFYPMAGGAEGFSVGPLKAGILSTFLYSLGIDLNAQGKLDAAIDAYREAIRVYPGYSFVHRNLGRTLLARGDLDAAIEAYRKALTLDPEDAVIHRELGRALYARGDFDAAFAAYREAIFFDPKDMETYFQFGSDLYEQGRFAEAIAIYREALTVKPKDPLTYRELGRALFAQAADGPVKDSAGIEEAINAYKKSLSFNPLAAEISRALGFAKYNSGAFDDAILLYRKSLKIDARDVITHENLQLALSAKGGSEADIGASKAKVRDLKKSEAQTYYDLGHTYRAQGKFEEAKAAVSDAERIVSELKHFRSEVRDGPSVAREGVFNLYREEAFVSRSMSDLDRAYNLSDELAARKGEQQILLIGVGRGYVALELALKFPKSRIIAVNKEPGLWDDDAIEESMLRKYPADAIREAKKRIDLKVLDIEDVEGRKAALAGHQFDFVVFETMTQIYMRDKVKVMQDLFNESLKINGVYAFAIDFIYTGTVDSSTEGTFEEKAWSIIRNAFGRSASKRSERFDDPHQYQTYEKRSDRVDIPLELTRVTEDLDGSVAPLIYSYYKVLSPGQLDGGAQTRSATSEVDKGPGRSGPTSQRSEVRVPAGEEIAPEPKTSSWQTFRKWLIIGAIFMVMSIPQMWLARRLGEHASFEVNTGESGYLLNVITGKENIERARGAGALYVAATGPFKEVRVKGHREKRSIGWVRGDAGTGSTIPPVKSGSAMLKGLFLVGSDGRGSIMPAADLNPEEFPEGWFPAGFQAGPMAIESGYVNRRLGNWHSGIFSGRKVAVGIDKEGNVHVLDLYGWDAVGETGPTTDQLIERLEAWRNKFRITDALFVDGGHTGGAWYQQLPQAALMAFPRASSTQSFVRARDPWILGISLLYVVIAAAKAIILAINAPVKKIFKKLTRIAGAAKSQTASVSSSAEQFRRPTMTIDQIQKLTYAGRYATFLEWLKQNRYLPVKALSGKAVVDVGSSDGVATVGLANMLTGLSVPAKVYAVEPSLRASGDDVISIVDDHRLNGEGRKIREPIMVMTLFNVTRHYYSYEIRPMIEEAAQKLDEGGLLVIGNGGPQDEGRPMQFIVYQKASGKLVPREIVLREFPRSFSIFSRGVDMEEWTAYLESTEAKRLGPFFQKIDGALGDARMEVDASPGIAGEDLREKTFRTQKSLLAKMGVKFRTLADGSVVLPLDQWAADKAYLKERLDQVLGRSEMRTQRPDLSASFSREEAERRAIAVRSMEHGEELLDFSGPATSAGSALSMVSDVYYVNRMDEYLKNQEEKKVKIERLAGQEETLSQIIMELFRSEKVAMNQGGLIGVFSDKAAVDHWDETLREVRNQMERVASLKTGPETLAAAGAEERKLLEVENDWLGRALDKLNMAIVRLQSRIEILKGEAPKTPTNLEDVMALLPERDMEENGIRAIVEVRGAEMDRAAEFSGNPLSVASVFYNLIVNGRKAWEENTAEGKDIAPKIIITLSRDDKTGELVIEVADNGKGLSKKQQAFNQETGRQNIFDLDNSERVDQGGTGLGTTEAWYVIKDMGGTIIAGNRPEGGAKFTIRLPILSAEKRSEMREDTGRLHRPDAEEAPKMIALHSVTQDALENFRENDETDRWLTLYSEYKYRSPAAIEKIAQQLAASAKSIEPGIFGSKEWVLVTTQSKEFKTPMSYVVDRLAELLSIPHAVYKTEKIRPTTSNSNAYSALDLEGRMKMLENERLVAALGQGGELAGKNVIFLGDAYNTGAIAVKNMRQLREFGPKNIHSLFILRLDFQFPGNEALINDWLVHREKYDAMAKILDETFATENFDKNRRALSLLEQKREVFEEILKRLQPETLVHFLFLAREANMEAYKENLELLRQYVEKKQEGQRSEARDISPEFRAKVVDPIGRILAERNKGTGGQILVLTGPAGSGKTEIGKFLKDNGVGEYGPDAVVFMDADDRLRSWKSKRHFEKQFAAEEGLLKEKHRLIILSGVYAEDFLKDAKYAGPRVNVLLDAPPEIARARALARDREVGNYLATYKLFRNGSYDLMLRDIPSYSPSLVPAEAGSSFSIVSPVFYGKKVREQSSRVSVEDMDRIIELLVREATQSGLRVKVDPLSKTLSDVEGLILGIDATLMSMRDRGSDFAVMTVRTFEKGLEVVLEAQQGGGPRAYWGRSLYPEQSHTSERFFADEAGWVARTIDRAPEPSPVPTGHLRTVFGVFSGTSELEKEKRLRNFSGMFRRSEVRAPGAAATPSAPVSRPGQGGGELRDALKREVAKDAEAIRLGYDFDAVKRAELRGLSAPTKVTILAGKEFDPGIPVANFITMITEIAGTIVKMPTALAVEQLSAKPDAAMPAGKQPGLVVDILDMLPSEAKWQAIEAVLLANEKQHYGLILPSAPDKAFLDRVQAMGPEFRARVHFNVLGVGSAEPVLRERIDEIFNKVQKEQAFGAGVEVFVVIGTSAHCDKLEKFEGLRVALVERTGDIDPEVLDTAGTVVATRFSQELQGEKLSEKTSKAIQKKSGRRYLFIPEGLKALLSQLTAEIQGLQSIRAAA